MAFDPSIIMGYRGMGELPNPMNQLAQVSQIQNAQNQNALAQYQLSSAQRADEQQRSLYAAAANPDFKLDVNTALRYGPAGIAALKAQQEALSAGLTQQKLRGDILAQTPKLQNDVSEQFKKQLTNVNDYNSAVNWLDKQYKHPALGPLMAQMPFEEAVRQIPQDPAKFQEWKAKNALGIEEFIKQNKPSVTAQVTGALTRLLSTPGLGFGGATVVPGSEAAMTATPGDLLADARAKQRLQFDQTKFKWEKDNPTLTIQEDQNGLLAVNTRTGMATPVVYGPTGFQPAPAAAPGASMMRQQPAALPGQRTPAIPGMASVLDQTGAPAAMPVPAEVGARMPGMPVGSKKEAPAKFNDTDMQLAGLAGSLKDFKDEVSKNLFTGAKFVPSGQDTARMTAKYTALLMGVKDLYTLGALTGPDMSIIESQITNPASWSGKFTTKKGFEEQTKVIEDMLKRTTTNLESTYGRVPKASRKALEALPGGAAGGIPGATETNPLALRIPGVR